MRKIVLITPSLHRFDAIGQDIFLTKVELERAGHTVEIFAEFFEAALPGDILDRSTFQDRLMDTNCILICHFGTYWTGLDELIESARCTIVLRYHNITPPELFLPWDESSYHGTFAARAQVIRLVNHPKVSLVLSASSFNVYELTRLVGHMRFRFAVLPPFSAFGTGDGGLDPSSPLNPGHTNLLFVGRIVPNKGHVHLLKTLRQLNEADPARNWKLTLVGKVSQALQDYFQHLLHLVQEWGLSGHVEFLGETTPDVLTNLYRQSDVFLCLSDHEGFCVPLIEAQAHNLPVVAWNKGALGDTIGWGSGMVMTSEWDGTIAHRILEICNDRTTRQRVIEEGRRNVALYDRSILGRQLFQFLATV